MTLRQLREVLPSILINWLLLLPVELHAFQELEATILELQAVDELLLEHVRIHLGVPGEDEEVDAVQLLDGDLVEALDPFQVHDRRLAVRLLLYPFVQVFVDVVSVAGAEHFEGLEEALEVLEVVVPVRGDHHRQVEDATGEVREDQHDLVEHHEQVDDGLVVVGCVRHGHAVAQGFALEVPRLQDLTYE